MHEAGKAIGEAIGHRIAKRINPDFYRDEDDKSDAEDGDAKET
jgi:hypothetical protein